MNPRAEAGRWRNNTKGEKSAQKGGFRKLHRYLRGDGERATVSIAGRGTEHSWRKKSGAVGSMEGGEPGGIGGPAQEETMEAAVLGQEICGKK